MRKEKFMIQKFETDEEYTNELHRQEKQMIIEYKKFYDEECSDKKLKMSFEAKIGSKLDDYAKIKSKRFYSAADFRDAWFFGVVKYATDDIKSLLRNPILREYAIVFIERCYIRDPKKFNKLKLNQSDREIYLGENKNVIGFFVAPEYTDMQGWHSYQLKGLKCKYNYLTLRQLIQEGYLKGKIDSSNEFVAEKVEVRDFNDIRKFYMNFEKSGSPFEKKFINCYLNYVKQQNNWKDVPILLPEVRWNEKEFYHKYRVDYLIINYYTGKRLAIEISPNSTHLCGSDIKKDWIKENNKRNSYFFKYDVPTITFTEEYVHNIQGCFDAIKGIFEVYEEVQPSFEEIIKWL